MEKLNSKTERIRCICDFLDRGGGTLVEMQSAVNQGLTNKGFDEIAVRSLRYSLRQLQDGDFEHSRSHLPELERKSIFKVQYLAQFVAIPGQGFNFPFQFHKRK